MDGQIYKVPCKRTNQTVEERILALRRRAQPPRMKDPGPNGDYYNHADPAYLDLQTKYDKMARALRVYTGCPVIAAKKPGLTNEEEIYSS